MPSFDFNSVSNKLKKFSKLGQASWQQPSGHNIGHSLPAYKWPCHWQHWSIAWRVPTLVRGARDRFRRWFLIHLWNVANSNRYDTDVGWKACVRLLLFVCWCIPFIVCGTMEFLHSSGVPPIMRCAIIFGDLHIFPFTRSPSRIKWVGGLSSLLTMLEWREYLLYYQLLNNT